MCPLIRIGILLVRLDPSFIMPGGRVCCVIGAVSKAATQVLLEAFEPGLVLELFETYRGNAMLHFHEDPLGFFADLKVDGEFTRLAVNTKREEAEFLRRATVALRAVVSRHPKSDA